MPEGAAIFAVGSGAEPDRFLFADRGGDVQVLCGTKLDGGKPACCMGGTRVAKALRAKQAAHVVGAEWRVRAGRDWRHGRNPPWLYGLLACREGFVKAAKRLSVAALTRSDTARMLLSRLLARIADTCRRRPVLVVLGGLVLFVLALAVAWARLGVSTDTDDLFDATLPWRQREVSFDRKFPQFHNLLVTVVDGATPEAAEQTATQLATIMRADHAHFSQVRQPDNSAYLQANGLLFLNTETLGKLLDTTIDAQPFLGQLVSDPSARGLFAALNLVAMGVERGQANLTAFAPALAGFQDALQAAADGHPTPLSWQRLLAGQVSDLGGPYRFVLARAVIDNGALQPGGAATAAIREAASQLEFVRDGTSHVRITGGVALADEEFATVAEGALENSLGGLALVVVWLVLALRSWRLIVPVLATLFLGLALTTGFAAIAVGRLNLVSVAFAVLFVGIAVDFGIQFGVRYREQRRALRDDPQAGSRTMSATAHIVGPQIMVAAVASAAGFLAFVPTSFVGVAELGLIAGVGILIAFACTLTFLPAALTLCRPTGEAAETGFAWADRFEGVLVRVRVPVLAVFAVLGLVGILALPLLAFDGDPLHTKNPNTESMRTLQNLIDNPITNPYIAEILTPSRREADAVAERLRKLPAVSQALTLDSFVPGDQPAKLALIADAAGILRLDIGAARATRAGDAGGSTAGRSRDRAADRSRGAEAGTRCAAAADRP